MGFRGVAILSLLAGLALIPFSLLLLTAVDPTLGTDVTPFAVQGAVLLAVAIVLTVAGSVLLPLALVSEEQRRRSPWSGFRGCFFCGAPLAPGSPFCPRCGGPVP